MKKLLPVFILLILSTSCVDKNPDLDEAIFKKEQQDYEAKKKNKLASNQEYLIEHGAVIQERLKTIYKVQDSAFDFTGISTDTTFFLSGKRLAISSTGSFPKKSQNNQVESRSKILVVNRRNGTFKESRYVDPYERLYMCMDNFEDLCDDTDLIVMEELVATHYVAVIEELMRMTPSIESKGNFNGGLFIARIKIYDVLNDKPLIQITASATNSDELSYREGGYLSENPSSVIKRDFEMNIYSSIEKALRRHFTLSNTKRNFY